METSTILLVEDNPDDVALTLRALKKADIRHRVVVARDGVEALGLLFGKGNGLAPVRPDLVILDLKLPRVDGVEVLRRLRSDDRTVTLPVVVLTTSNETQDVKNCYRFGANSYIRKPVDFGQFSDVIRQVGHYWLQINEALP